MKAILKLLARLETLRSRSRWSRQGLAAYQREELQRVRDHAYRYSPFYRRFHAGLQDRPLEDLPVLTREILMENFDDLVTDRPLRIQTLRELLKAAAGESARSRRGHHVVISRGTVEAPGVFVYEDDAWLTALAGMARLQDWAGHPIRMTHRRKMVTLSPPDPSNVITQLAQTAATWSRFWPVRGIPTDKPGERLAQWLNRWQPEVLGLDPSTALELAQLQADGTLRISPRLVTLGGESVTENVVQRVVAAWGVRPFEAYGTSEIMPLAGECTEHTGLHVMEDLAVVEIVDEQNRPVPPGGYGAKVLVTVLGRMVQPLIRYEVRDSVRVVEERCPCGKPFALIDSVRRRPTDVITAALNTADATREELT